jgi:hypothetical protein
VKPLGIPITLDRPRILLLDEDAFELIRQSTGIDVKEAMRAALDRDGVNGFPMTLEITRGLILAGCLAEDSRLTLKTVSQYVTPQNHERFHLSVTKAIFRGHDIPYASKEHEL